MSGSLGALDATFSGFDQIEYGALSSIGDHNPFSSIGDHNPFSSIGDHNPVSSIGDHNRLPSIGDHNSLSSIGATMVFDSRPGGPPTLVDLHAAVSARVGAQRRYTQRLSSLRAGHFFWPRWEPDPQFEIGHHIRRATLSGRGDERQLCEWTSEFFSHPFDASRPLWELVLLEGLEHGRWALAHNVHHCLQDGVGSVDVVGLLLDDQPGVAPGWSGRISGSRFAASRSRARRYAVVRAPMAELRTGGRVLGGSLDDVLLAACAGGLRHLLLERGEPLGNPIGSRFGELPIDEPVAAARVARVAAATRRRGPALRPGLAIETSLGSTAPFDVTITSVAGSPEPVYAFGAPLRRVLPIVPSATQDAVGIAIFSYDGEVAVGLSTDGASVPDLDVLATGIEESLEELRGYGT